MSSYCLCFEKYFYTYSMKGLHTYVKEHLSYVRSVGIQITAAALLVEFVWLTSHN